MTQDKTGGPAWQDATSYRRGERGHIDPTAWAIEAYNVRVWVGKHLRTPGQWALTCNALNIEAQPICDDDAHHVSAKDAALSVVVAALRYNAENFRRAADAMIAARNGGQDT